MKKLLYRIIVLLFVATLIIIGAIHVFASADDMYSAYSAKRYEKAVEEADELLREDEMLMDAYYIKVMSCFYLDDIKGAYDTLKAQLSFNPKNELALYNAACAASLLNLEDESLGLLERLFVLNMSERSHVQSDADFDNIRDLDGYKKLMETTVIFGGELLEFDVAPTIVEDRLLLPLREIFEAFGAEVFYISETRTVKAEKPGYELELIIGESTAFVNKEEKSLDVAPIIMDGRTMVPLRFIAEALDAQVDWDGQNKVASILTAAPSGNADYESAAAEMNGVLATLSVEGGFSEPYSMRMTEGISFLVFKEAKGLEIFNSLSASDKTKYVSGIIDDNYPLLLGCNPIYAKVVYNGRVYYDGEFNYKEPEQLLFTYYEKGKPANIVKQYSHGDGDNYKDFYMLPVDEQTTSVYRSGRDYAYTPTPPSTTSFD